MDVLGWPDPDRWVDVYAERRCLRNGLPSPAGNGLLGAMVELGLPVQGAADEKDSMRALAIRGGPFSTEERAQLLAYCAEDVSALVAVVEHLPPIDVRHAELRGAYSALIGKIENIGVPVDLPTLLRLREAWPVTRGSLVADAGLEEFWPNGSFSAAAFESWLRRQGIHWPRLPSGKPALDDQTFRTMAARDRRIGTIRETRHALSQLRLERIAVGTDGRNRTNLSPYGTKTGRNAPSNSQFIFGVPSWLRRLIMPEPGRALAYLDYSKQEYGIAAALSGDRAMQASYLSPDAYLDFAVQAGAAPLGATKASHGVVRDQFKACALGVLYGMGAETLAQRIGTDPIRAKALIDLHRRTFPDYWKWCRRVLDHAMLVLDVGTCFGWHLHITRETKRRTIANFPMQANGAEILRVACLRVAGLGIRICAPVHDALLIDARTNEIDEAVAAAREAMIEASRDVLGGFALKVDAKVLMPGERFAEARGAEMWARVVALLHRHDGKGVPK